MTTHSNHSNRAQDLASRQQELLASLDHVLNVLSPWKLVDERELPDSIVSVLMKREAACDSHTLVSAHWQRIGSSTEIRLSTVRRSAGGTKVNGSLTMLLGDGVPSVQALMEWTNTYLRWSGFTLIDDEESEEKKETNDSETQGAEAPVPLAPIPSATPASQSDEPKAQPKAQPKLKSKPIPAQRKKETSRRTHPQAGTLIHTVLEYVKNNPSCTRSDVKKDFLEMGYKGETASAALTDLRERGYVKVESKTARIGTPNGGRVTKIQFFTATNKE